MVIRPSRRGSTLKKAPHRGARLPVSPVSPVSPLQSRCGALPKPLPQPPPATKTNPPRVIVWLRPGPSQPFLPPPNKEGVSTLNPKDPGSLYYTHIIQGNFAQTRISNWRDLLDCAVHTASQKGVPFSSIEQSFVHKWLRAGGRSILLPRTRNLPFLLSPAEDWRWLHSHLKDVR